MDEKAKIFIIEDDPDAAEVMKVTLQARNYQVITVSDPAKGFNKAKQAKPNLIILDVMFGKQEMTRGFDCAVKMKQDTDLVEYLPVDDFIDKPAQPSELVEKVEKLLE